MKAPTAKTWSLIAFLLFVGAVSVGFVIFVANLSFFDPANPLFLPFWALSIAFLISVYIVNTLEKKEQPHHE